jgi:ATP diphosphatase
VFGPASADDAGAAKASWDTVKAQEKADRLARRRAALDGEANASAGLLDEVPRGAPALHRAVKMQQAAARVGFDWGAATPILDKIDEELGELKAAIASGERAAVSDEMGDLLFSVVNLCRHLDIDPEAALRGTNQKFADRFRFVERELAARGSSPAEASLAEMEMIWSEAKRVMLRSGEPRRPSGGSSD